MNAAFRIATFLEGVMSAGSGESIAEIAAKRLEIERNSPGYLLTMGCLISQLQEVRLAVIATEPSERAMAVYERAFYQINPLIDPYFQNTNAVQVIKDRHNDINQLFVMSDLLKNEAIAFDEASRAAAITEIEALKSRLEELDLDSVLWAQLKMSLDFLLMALRLHDVLGSQGMARIFGGVTFEMAQTVNAARPSSPESKRWFQDALATIKKVGAAIVWAGAVATGASQIVDFTGDVLSIGGGDAAADAGDTADGAGETPSKKTGPIPTADRSIV